MAKNNFLKFSMPFLVLFVISAIILRIFFVDASSALSIAAVLSLSFFAAYIYYLITKERGIRSRLEGRLSAIETSAREMQNNGGDAAFTAVSREEKERISFDSAFKTTDSISGTLALLKNILGCHNCILVDVGEKGHTLIASASPDGDTRYKLPNESAESLLGWIAEHRVPLRIGRIRDRKGLSYYTSDKGINSFLGVPVFEQAPDRFSRGQGDKLRAVLCVDSKENEAFGQEAERLLVFAAHGISEFLKNASHLSRMKTEAAEFAAFYRLSKRLSSTFNLDEILDIAAASSKEIVDYDMAVFLLKQDSEILKVAAAKGFKAAELLNKTFHRDESLAGWVVKNGKPLSFTDFQDGKRDVPVFPGQHIPMRSLICLPLSVKDDILGVFLTASKKENFFSPYEMRIFEVIAAHTATHIANARMYQQAERMATTDGLTGLFNHRYFQERLATELERGERYKQKASLVLVDIDHFKKVNDTYGHPAGDKILKEVAKILASSVRTVDVAARYGGEEFAIILVNTDAQGALETAERIRKIMEGGKFDIGGGSAIKITGSMGIAVFPDDTGMDDGSQRLLISKTDSAMYLAKKEGRNRVYLFKDVAERIEKKQETSKQG